MKELELLAPAKNLEIGTAAIDCGADAVYIAGSKFGAREKAGNSFEDISALCSYAHGYGSKVYITINTLLKKEEIREAQEYIKKGYSVGCDGVIIQDPRVLIGAELPPIKLIASTQCNIRTPERAQMLEKVGFKRIILARELSLEQIKKIKESVSCELEFFVHGALCVCYSGCCYLSEYLTDRSANRGECAQPCRANYDLVTDDGKEIVKNSPLLSLKDLNLSDRIGDLVAAGISSFKIEGRLKNISYIKNIVTLYNKELNKFISSHRDEYCRSSLGESRTTFEPRPLTTFNRGYCNYFIEGETLEKRNKHLNSGVAKYIGESVGEVVTTLSSANKHNEIKISYKCYSENNSLCNGDGICFVLPSGVILGGRINWANEHEATVQLSETTDIQNFNNLTIYRNFNFNFEKSLSKEVKRVIPVEIELLFDERQKMRISCGEKNFTFDEECFPSKDKERCAQIIKSQFNKNSGNYIFNVVKISGNVPFYKLSTLNKIRRELSLLLKEDLKRQKISAEQNCQASEMGSYTIPGNFHNTIKEREILQLVRNMHLDENGWRSFDGCSNGELMRTKYCLRYELGCCLKKSTIERREKGGKLLLFNNGKSLELEFDCKKCEMVIKASDKKE